MMPPELVDVIANVQEQIGEQLDMLERDGGQYARDYAQAALAPKRIQGPAAPRGWHPHIRKMVQELVSEELLVRRHQHARSS